MEEASYSHEEAARKLGVTVKTLASYRAKGLIVATVKWQGLRPRYAYSARSIAACAARLEGERTKA